LAERGHFKLAIGRDTSPDSYQGNGGEVEAQGQFIQSHFIVTWYADTVVARHGQEAPAGHSVTIHNGHNGAWKGHNAHEGTTQSFDNVPGIVIVPFRETHNIQTGAEKATITREDRAVEVVIWNEGFGHGSEKRQIHGVGGTVVHAEDFDPSFNG
jgi:hypothetical protein